MGARGTGVAVALTMASLFDLGFAASARAEVSVDEFRLDNGMTFLLVERPGREMVAAAWGVRAGSGEERPGSTGVAHLLEHLLFGGTQVIGTRDWPAEARLLGQLDDLQRQVDSLAGDSSRRRRVLRERIEDIERQMAEIRIEGEYARHYAEAGAVGLDAQTNKDMSLYSVALPRSRLELWFWLESDRLLNPVFRGLSGEIEVVAQERRERLESSELGEALERFDREFWGRGHPYSWSTDGLPGELHRLQREQVREHFETHHVGPDLVAVLVGDFDSKWVKQQARRYFGRLSGGPDQAAALERNRPEAAVPPTKSVAEPEDPRAPARMTHTCRCRPQAELRYPGVPFTHPEAAVFDVIAALLSGRTGRLHTSIVMKKGGAFSASTRHSAYRRGGSFSVFATGAVGSSASLLAVDLEAQVTRLGTQLVSAHELEKAINRLRTDAARDTKEPLGLALRLLAFESLGDWRRINTDSKIAGITPAEIRRVAARYLVPERQSVLLVESGAEP